VSDQVKTLEEIIGSPEAVKELKDQWDRTPPAENDDEEDSE